MKTETQPTAELAQLCQLLEPMTIAMLTTFDTHGALVSQPMVPLEMDETGALWFFTDLRSEKVEHLQVLNLAFGDVPHSTYVSISGHGEIHTDAERIERLWTPMARPWFPDGVESTHLGLLKIVPHEAEYWDAPHSRMVRMFAMAASAVAGKPLALGEHAVLTDLSEPARYPQPV
ncbi:General stress protein 26 [Rhodoferax sp. OV413]|uniref:pyridoxamine 5'-phosphate oxidase family protein n=1 Tax=Rhodoferax sp. OV413 TaxID=1855285 RepID=UPI000885C960|nr:pyridoxamine 5'-phosphate oxidase family protein [Rhodoferax sp. OV413]SDP46703.1 General stress protein 26 [Rhodoferax sp. OV413]